MVTLNRTHLEPRQSVAINKVVHTSQIRNKLSVGHTAARFSDNMSLGGPGGGGGGGGDKPKHPDYTGVGEEAMLG